MTTAINSSALLPSIDLLRNMPIVLEPATMSEKVATQLTSKAAAASVQPVHGQQVSLREPAVEVMAPEAMLALLQASPELRAEAEEAAAQKVLEQLPAEDRTAPSIMQKIKDDPQFAQLVAWMLMHLQTSKTHRTDSVQAVNRSYLSMQHFGVKTVDVATKNMIGAVTQAVTTLAVASAGAAKTMKGNSNMRESTNVNTNPGNEALKRNAATRQAGTGVPETARVPAGSDRARNSNIEGSDIQLNHKQINEERATLARESNAEPAPAQTHASQSTSYAFAQDNYARGQLISVMANPIGAIASSGASISAATDQAEASMSEHAARTNTSMANNESDQVKEQQQSRDAVLKLLQDIWNERAATASYILSKA